MIDIKTGLLMQARQCLSPNYNDRQSLDDMTLIVIHNITLPPNQFGGPWIDKLFTNQLPAEKHPFFAVVCHLRVSSHVLIRRDGEIVQYVPFHKRAWHAGVSCYQQREACNDYSVGIELEGTDDTPFSESQYTSLEYLIDALLATYPTLKAKHITGHEHIAPNRKTDPGKYFDWQRLSAYLSVSLPAQ